MPIPAIIGTIIAKAVGGALGKTAEKLIDYIPNKDEHIRNRISALKREQDELKKKPTSDKNNRRLDVVADELRKLLEKSTNR